MAGSPPAIRTFTANVTHDPLWPGRPTITLDTGFPSHTAQLRSSLNLMRRMEFDQSLYYTARLPGGQIPGRARLDLRLARHLGESVEISVVGQDLLHARTMEHGDSWGIVATQVVRRGVRPGDLEILTMRIQRLAAITAAACMFGLSAQVNEYQVKAFFLSNFARYVEWPADKFQAPNDPLAICIFGANPFGSAPRPGDRRQARGRPAIRRAPDHGLAHRLQLPHSVSSAHRESKTFLGSGRQHTRVWSTDSLRMAA